MSDGFRSDPRKEGCFAGKDDFPPQRNAPFPPDTLPGMTDIERAAVFPGSPGENGQPGAACAASPFCLACPFGNAQAGRGTLLISAANASTPFRAKAPKGVMYECAVRASGLQADQREQALGRVKAQIAQHAGGIAVKGGVVDQAEAGGRQVDERGSVGLRDQMTHAQETK